MTPLLTRIPITRLDQADPELLEELLAVVSRVAHKGAFTMGAELEAFESEFAAYCETDHAVGVSSGTEAIVLALKALSIGAGDEVIVPSNSFIATAEAVSLAGATPRLVDVDPFTHLLSADAVEAAIGPRTRCVIPVHLMGSTVDVQPLLEVARAAGIAVVEDCAQAHGARYEGRRVGTFGDIGCFSMYPTKNLGAWGDGGAIVTADPALAEPRQAPALARRAASLPPPDRRHDGAPRRDAGCDPAREAPAARRLERGPPAHRRDASRGPRRLRRRASRARRASLGDHVYHLFIVRTQRREALRAFLDERGVSTAVHYPFPIHRTEAYAELGLGQGSLPVAERLAEEICTLPLFPSMSDDEVAQVIEAVQDFNKETS